MVSYPERREMQHPVGHLEGHNRVQRWSRWQKKGKKVRYSKLSLLSIGHASVADAGSARKHRIRGSGESHVRTLGPFRTTFGFRSLAAIF